jgi:hypothetical protein
MSEDVASVVSELHRLVDRLIAIMPPSAPGSSGGDNPAEVQSFAFRLDDDSGFSPGGWSSDDAYQSEFSVESYGCGCGCGKYTRPEARLCNCFQYIQLDATHRADLRSLAARLGQDPIQVLRGLYRRAISGLVAHEIHSAAAALAPHP